MSQAGILTPSGGGGGGVDIRTITGNDLVAVGPNAAHNLDLRGINGTTVEIPNPLVANRLNISSGTVSATVTTVDDTPTILATYTLGASTAVTLNALVVGAHADIGSEYTASVWSQVIGGARRAAAGGAVLVEAPMPLGLGDDFAGVPIPLVTMAVAGNNLNIMVTGLVATTINWKAMYTFIALP